MTDMERIIVWGAGAWGTALAIHLASSGRKVSLWVFEKEQYDTMLSRRENVDFLPGFPLPDELNLFYDPESVPRGAVAWLSVAPAQVTRALWSKIGSMCDTVTLVISASKGIEQKSLLSVSSVIEEHLPPGCAPVVALSGPSFAKGLAGGDPTAVVVASPDKEKTFMAQKLISSRPLRAYSADDRIGVELGGAAKNVVAISCGIAAGLGLGPNTVAALMTRGLSEIVRLGEAMGARARTFYGLSGVGDLTLTCTDAQSRNRTVGFRLGRGENLEEILASVKTVAEGVATTHSVADLARRYNVEMPITFTVERILYDGLTPSEALDELLKRRLKSEMG